MTDKFVWQPDDIEIDEQPMVDNTRELLEEEHGKLFPDDNTVELDSQELAFDIVDAHGGMPSDNEDKLIGQALGYIRKEQP